MEQFRQCASASIPNYQTQLTLCSGLGARPHPGGVDFPGLAPDSGPWWLFALGEGAKPPSPEQGSAW